MTSSVIGIGRNSVISVSYCITLSIDEALTDRFTAESLTSKLTKARDSLHKKKTEFARTDANMRSRFGEDLVKEWEGMSTLPFQKDDGQWDSVYRPKKELGMFCH